MTQPTATSEARRGDPVLSPPRIRRTPPPAGRGALFSMPGIERAGNGRLWAVWVLRERYDLTPGAHGDAAANRLLAASSEDEGQTWDHALTIESPPGPLVGIWAPLVWHDPTGRLWVCWSQGTPYAGARVGDTEYGITPVTWAIHTEQSDRAAPAWSAPRQLFEGRIANKPLVRSNGEWLFQTDRTREKGTPREMTRSNVFVSRDDGATFELRGGVDVPEGAHLEHMIVERREGSLWMLLRVGGGVVRPGGPPVPPGLAESVSADGGCSWSAPTRSAIAGPSARFFLRRLVSGRLLLINHRGFDPAVLLGRTHLTASLSDDDGASWHAHMLLHDDAHTRVNLPDAIQAPDGRILAVYSRTSCDAQLRPVAQSIVLSCFTETDIEHGRMVSAGSFKERVIQTINKENAERNS